MSKRIDKDLLKGVTDLPIEEQKEILELLEALEETEQKERTREEFLGFAKYV